MFGVEGSKNTHDHLSIAVHNKHSVQHRLQFQQQISENQRFRLKTAESQLQSATAQLHTLRSNLNQTQISYKHMTTLAKEFKDLETYLKEVLVSSTVFQDQLINLIDFEHVIEPLKDIYQQMINNKLINFNNNNKSIEIIHLTNESLEKAKEMIKTWNIIIMDEDNISTPYLFIEDD
jgi:hypothetical protein